MDERRDNRNKFKFNSQICVRKIVKTKGFWQARTLARIVAGMQVWYRCELRGMREKAIGIESNSTVEYA